MDASSAVGVSKVATRDRILQAALRGFRRERVSQGAGGRHRARLAHLQGRRLPPLPQQGGALPRPRRRVLGAPRRVGGRRPSPTRMGRSARSRPRCAPASRPSRRHRELARILLLEAVSLGPAYQAQARRGARALRRPHPGLPRSGGGGGLDPAARHARGHPGLAGRRQRAGDPVAPRGERRSAHATSSPPSPRCSCGPSASRRPYP